MFTFVSRPSKTTPRVAFVLFGTLLIAACYGERLPPPTFRFDCDSAEDCNENEACRDGLCQIPCTTSTFEEDCPSGEGFAMCFNGVCSHLCPIEKDVCPPPQICLEFSQEAASSSGGMGGGGGDDMSFGICGVLCENADDCPAGEICMMGVCLPVDSGGTGDDGSTGTDTTGTDGGSGS